MTLADVWTALSASLKDIRRRAAKAPDAAPDTPATDAPAAEVPAADAPAAATAPHEPPAERPGTPEKPNSD